LRHVSVTWWAATLKDAGVETSLVDWTWVRKAFPKDDASSSSLEGYCDTRHPIYWGLITYKQLSAGFMVSSTAEALRIVLRGRTEIVAEG
jgi:hypothetical protein